MERECGCRPLGLLILPELPTGKSSEATSELSSIFFDELNFARALYTGPLSAKSGLPLAGSGGVLGLPTLRMEHYMRL